MKTTERFDRAVTKLYNAFHYGKLNALDCEACAVGNMCDNSRNWGNYGRFTSRTWDDRPTKEMMSTGYSAIELKEIEDIFMSGRMPNGDRRFYRGLGAGDDIETNFKGLCAVVEYLCELDGIPNVMDYTKLFEYDKELNPIHPL